MLKRLSIAAIAAGTAMAVPAQAETVKVANDINLNLGSCGISGSGNNTACQGYFQFSAFGQDTRVNVKATAWAVNGGSNFQGTHSQIQLRSYSNGLGATNTLVNEPTSSPNHAFDNKDGREYLVVEFSEEISVEQFVASVYNGYDNYADNDYSIAIGTLANGWENYVNAQSGALSDFPTGFSDTTVRSGGYNNNRGRGDFGGTLTASGFSFGNTTGNTVILAADFSAISGGSSKYDFFKFSSLMVDVYKDRPNDNTDVPAPAPILLLGLGLAGLGWRQKKRAAA